MIVPDLTAPRVAGWRDILATCAALGWPLSRHQALRASLRRVNPFPLDGPERGQWSTRRALADWIAYERKRLNRIVLTDEQPRVPRLVSVPRNARNPRKP